ncbi:VQ motif-containing protein 10-like [Miscanthus floridulus]|uniref:VQ motif-containing protein 10-like n=1 Tax=Miscanthus floridulus TaxID=154761 RepID=UPI0034573F9C
MSTREDGNPKPVTVKIIETVYVEADTADDFKSVVQRLTGKDAVAAELEDSSRPAAPPQAAQSRMGQGRSPGDRKAAADAYSKRQNG